MGFIRERKVKGGGTRYQAEIRCGRHQLYSEAKHHTFEEAIDRYFKEQTVSVVKRGHLLWWKKTWSTLPS